MARVGGCRATVTGAFLVVSFALCFRGAEGTAQGALKLDNYTFDKALKIADTSILVKFDQSYAYGEKEDEFKELCKIAYQVPKFFIGEVPVQEYGDKENDDLRERFGLKKDDFPAYFFFNAANEGGLRYSGNVKAEDIAVWLRRQKVKMPVIGTIEELDALAKKFMKDKSDSTIAEAKKIAAEQYSTDAKAAVYAKIMQKIKEKGEEYVTTETARVAKLMNGKMSPEKMKELGDKIKILNIFGTKDEL